MDVTTSPFSLTQMILAWTLLGLLLTWLITFTLLALRSFVMKKAEWEDLPTPTKPLPAISIQSTQPANTQPQYVGVAFAPSHTDVGAATGDILPEGTKAETSRDIGTTPIM
jgi:hypothetical protein